MIPHAYKKILDKLSGQYKSANQNWAAERDRVRKSITEVRLTNFDAERVLRELEQMKKVKKTTRDRVRFI
jgi:hypothetical protein